MLVLHEVQGASFAELRVNHILSDGKLDSTWPAGGALIPALNAFNGYSAIATDGRGGAIVAWAHPTSGDRCGVALCRVTSTGEPISTGWPTDGPSGYWPYPPRLVPDDSCGVIVLFAHAQDGFTYDSRVFTYRILADGSRDPRWPAIGVQFRSEWNLQSIQAVPGPGGGLYGITQSLHDHRPYTPGFYTTSSVQGVGRDGRMWLELDVGPFQETGGVPDVIPDGDGGMWFVEAMEPPGRYIHLVRLRNDGSKHSVRLAEQTPEKHHLALAPDGRGGAFIGWLQSSAVGTQQQFFAIHVLASDEADPAWPPSGLAISPSDAALSSLRAVGDDRGGAIFVWRESRNVLRPTSAGSASRQTGPHESDESCARRRPRRTSAISSPMAPTAPGWCGATIAPIRTATSTRST